MSHPLRLDNSHFKSDIMDFLIKNGNGSENGSYISVFNWIKLYDLQIATNFEKLLMTVRDLFPNRYVTITPTEGDCSTYSINIHGVRDDKEYKKNHKVVYDFVEKIEKEWYDSKYSFLVHNVSMKDTIKYYPDELGHLIAMKQITNEECDVIRKDIKNEEEICRPKRKF